MMYKLVIESLPEYPEYKDYLTVFVQESDNVLSLLLVRDELNVRMLKFFEAKVYDKNQVKQEWSNQRVKNHEDYNQIREQIT